MKKFNKIGKVNTLYRTIATVLVFAIALLAFPEMKEVQAADYPSVDITGPGQEKSVTVTANDSGYAKLTINFPEEAECSVLGGTGVTVTTTDTSITFEWSSVSAGTDYEFTQIFLFEEEGLELESVVHVRLLGPKKVCNITISPLSSSIVYGTLSNYDTKSASSVVNIVFPSDYTGPRSVTYIKDGVDYTASQTNTPLPVGSYSVTAECEGDDTYKAGEASASFTVSKYTPTLSIPDVSPGETPHPTCTYATRGGSIATVDSLPNIGASINLPGIAYKGAGDEEYSFTVPTEPGDYSATLVYSSDSRLGDFNNDVTTTFKISLKEGKGKVTVADTVYGESSVKPKAESDTNDADKAEFFYKVKNTDDSTYTKDRPTKPGKYVCKAVFPKTGNYDSCSATCEFVIEKAKGVGTLSASDVYVGMEPKASPVSATNGVTAVTYQYKEKGASDSSYTDKVPTKPGEYTVKATFAATDYYLETSATANFKTSYMPAPTFGLTGEQGKNDFYTDTVSVKAPAGYEVSLSYGKDYKDSINILDGVKYVYFKDKATGALSDKAAVPSYKMDSVLPVVKGVKNNDTIFKDEYELEITDDYLEMVKVNDQTVPVKDGKATYKLTSDSGEMLYKIEATDQAGHTVTYTITVASPWVKDGFVPAGQIVKLKPGKAYSLKGGKKYKIKGDDTVYNGGTQFYVDEERELELEEYNEN